MEPFFSFLGGFVGAGATLLFSVHVFRQQRWWECKLDAYTNVVNALHDLKSSYEPLLKAEERMQEIDEKQQKIFDTKKSDAFAKLRRALDIGELIFSREAVVELQGLMKALRTHYDTYYEYLDAMSAAVESCLKSIRPIARRDLRLQSRIYTLLRLQN